MSELHVAPDVPPSFRKGHDVVEGGRPRGGRRQAPANVPSTESAPAAITLEDFVQGDDVLPPPQPSTAEVLPSGRRPAQARGRAVPRVRPVERLAAPYTRSTRRRSRSTWHLRLCLCDGLPLPAGGGRTARRAAVQTRVGCLLTRGRPRPWPEGRAADRAGNFRARPTGATPLRPSRDRLSARTRATAAGLPGVKPFAPGCAAGAQRPAMLAREGVSTAAAHPGGILEIHPLHCAPPHRG